MSAFVNRFIVILCFCPLVQLHGQSHRLDSILQAIQEHEPSDLRPLLVKYEAELRKIPKTDREKQAIKTISVLESAPNSERIIFALQQLGQFYQNLKMPAESIRFLQLAYQKAERSNSKLQMGLTLKQIALVYQNEQMLTESLTYIYQALRIFEEKKFNAKAIITLYEASLINYKASNYIGTLNDFSSAIELFNKLPRDSATTDIKFYMMSGWNTAGIANRALKKNKEGLAAFDEADKIAVELNNKFWKGLIAGNKGELLLQMGKREEAIVLIKQDMRVSMQVNQYSSAAIASCSLCETYTAMKDLKRAKNYLDTAIMMFSKMGYVSSVQRRLSLTMSNYYSASGDYENAFKALQKHLILKDSSFNQERLISLSQVKAQYELKKKQSEIELLSQRNEIQKEEIKNQGLLILASTLLIVLVGGFLFYVAFNNRKLKKKNAIIESQRSEIEAKNEELEVQSQVLQEQNLLVHTNVVELEERVKERTIDLQLSNQELDTFLYHASHDIRRPIATLLGLERVSRLSEGDASKHLFDCVAQTASDMDSMLSKLQMAYTINRPIEDFSWVSFHWIINEAATKFNEAFLHLKIDFIHEQKIQTPSLLSPSLLTIIFSNLIENAILFRKEKDNAFIRITSSQSDDLVIVTIEDNGIGIEKEYLEKVFDLYFRGTERSKGNGIGLYLVKKAVTILNGTIEVISQFEVGTTFKISFKLNKNRI